MRDCGDHFEEEYVYVADITDSAALIAWGAFFFDSKMKRVKDRDVHMLGGCEDRRTTIGWTAESYGQMTVEVIDPAGIVVDTVNTPNTYCWTRNLAPDTEYRYRVLQAQNGGPAREWGSGELCSYDRKAKELVGTKLEYNLHFRTFPSLATALGDEGLRFAVIGDTGTGTPVQEDVARALATAVDERGVRFVLSVGDTIYNKSGGSGDDDFEWLTTYFQPYRHIISHIPVYPCAGNHDTHENLLSGERQLDRLALYDNLLVPQRFRNAASHGITGRSASVGPGLFYRFQYGRDVELICLDTSKESLFADRLFEHDAHVPWMQTALRGPLDRAKLRIPFMHHPPYCKGPSHSDKREVQKQIVSACEASGIQTLFAGHEHNFQCIDSSTRQLRTFVTGGGGGFRTGHPDNASEGWMQFWGGHESGHFLIVSIGRDLTALVEPIDATGNPLPLLNAAGHPTPGVRSIPIAP